MSSILILMRISNLIRYSCVGFKSSILERFIRTRTCSRSAVVHRIIYWLRVSGVCVRMASMSYRHSFVLVIYRCISDRRREGAEYSGSLVVYNARVWNKASCSLSKLILNSPSSKPHGPE